MHAHARAAADATSTSTKNHCAGGRARLRLRKRQMEAHRIAVISPLAKATAAESTPSSATSKVWSDTQAKYTCTELELLYALYPVPPQSVMCNIIHTHGFTSFTNEDKGAADYTGEQARV